VIRAERAKAQEQGRAERAARAAAWERIPVERRTAMLVGAYPLSVWTIARLPWERLPEHTADALAFDVDALAEAS
jgi:hypothetical protein